jgi:hypothetical protein
MTALRKMGGSPESLPESSLDLPLRPNGVSFRTYKWSRLSRQSFQPLQFVLLRYSSRRTFAAVCDRAPDRGAIA